MLKLGVFGIEINSSVVGGEATIYSQMKEDCKTENELFNSAIDGVESMILAHHSSGIDVSSSIYIEGIETAYEAICNKFG